MREGRREEGREREEGIVLINRTSLSLTDSFIKPPKPSKLNAFTLLDTQARSLKPPLAKLAFDFAQNIPRQKREHQETVLLTKDPYFLNGGRLYTNSQLIPVKESPIRKFTTINRERCCEVDFSANHLRMSAAFFGQELCDDPYQEIVNIVKVSCRDQVKRVVASLISTKESETNKARYGLGYPEDKRLTPISFVTFDATYKAINQLFPWFKTVRGIGSSLQSIEGQILLETMSLLLKEGVISIPLHDALRVPAQHVQKTERIMLETWSKHLGVNFETKVTCKIN